MKIKLYNGGILALDVRVLAGGYDPELGRIVLQVAKADGSGAGSITLDVAEVRTISAILAQQPEATRATPTQD